jgi:hypothetical protein
MLLGKAAVLVFDKEPPGAASRREQLDMSAGIGLALETPLPIIAFAPRPPPAVLAVVDPKHSGDGEGDSTQRLADLLDLAGEALISALNSRHPVHSD